MKTKQLPATENQHPFTQKFTSRFSGVLRWPQLDDLWERVKADDHGWYIYSVGQTPPEEPATAEKLHLFIPEVDTLLRKEHDEDYCGVVYVDDAKQPGFIKIFDPNNLGTSCGMSDTPPLPSWILSKIKPIDLPNAMQPTGSRRRWWEKIFG